MGRVSRQSHWVRGGNILIENTCKLKPVFRIAILKKFVRVWSWNLLCMLKMPFPSYIITMYKPKNKQTKKKKKTVKFLTFLAKFHFLWFWPRVMASLAMGLKLGVFRFLPNTHAETHKQNASTIFARRTAFHACLFSHSDRSTYASDESRPFWDLPCISVGSALLYDVIVTSYVGCLCLFWYVWKEKTYSCTMEPIRCIWGLSF